MVTSDEEAPSEEKHIGRLNVDSRSFLSKEYLAVKNIGVLLIDLVPYERKHEMIEGLKRLFTPDSGSRRILTDEPRINSIPDIRQSGIRSGGGIVNIGTIVNSELGPDILAFQKKLPSEISYIEIMLGQFVDFAYYVVYTCGIREEYQNNNIERIFTESRDSVPFAEETALGNQTKGWKPKGPEFEPTIQKFKELVIQYLQPFSAGLFINRKTFQELSCPNLKVITVPHIDFDSFEQWEKDHGRLLSFLGFDLTLSQFGKMLVSYYRKSLFSLKPAAISEGLVFLASLDDFKDDSYVTADNEIINKIELLGSYDGRLTMILSLIYWTMYNIEVVQHQWKEKVHRMFNDMRNLKKRGSSLEEFYDLFCDAYKTFKQYKIEEDRNIRVANRSFDQYGFGKVAKFVNPLGSYEVNLFEGVSKENSLLLNLERTNLEDVSNEFDDLFSYSTNFVNFSLDRSNLRLQKSMNRMTIVMLFFTIAAVAIALTPFSSQILSLLMTNPTQSVGLALIIAGLCCIVLAVCSLQRKRGHDLSDSIP